MHDLTKGERVRLDHTSDPYTDLRPGALGTVSRVSTQLGDLVIDVDWDDGSRLSMIPASGDHVSRSSV